MQIDLEPSTFREIITCNLKRTVHCKIQDRQQKLTSPPPPKLVSASSPHSKLLGAVICGGALPRRSNIRALDRTAILDVTHQHYAIAFPGLHVILRSTYRRDEGLQIPGAGH